MKEHAYRNIPLDYEEAYDLGQYALEGCNGNNLAQIQSIAALCALHTKATYAFIRKNKKKRWRHEIPENSSQQIAGICASIFNNDIAKSEFGFLRPQIHHAVDNCGMGGDLVATANVSTISAFIAAAANIPMLKHGSPANADSGRHGSSDFIDLCGINTYASKREIENCVTINKFGYTEALDTRYKLIHVQTHKIAHMPHMNDLIGPITNPLDPKLLDRRLLGINHLLRPKIVAEAYAILNEKKITNVKHALFVRGFVGSSGIDELSTCKEGSVIAELKNNEITEYRLLPNDFGLKPAKPASISPPGNMSKGEFSMKILRGEITGPSLEMILANSALLFYIEGRSDDLKECYLQAEETFSSGKAYEKMLDVKKTIPKPI